MSDISKSGGRKQKKNRSKGTLGSTEVKVLSNSSTVKDASIKKAYVQNATHCNENKNLDNRTVKSLSGPKADVIKDAPVASNNLNKIPSKETCFEPKDCKLKEETKTSKKLVKDCQKEATCSKRSEITESSSTDNSALPQQSEELLMISSDKTNKEEPQEIKKENDGKNYGNLDKKKIVEPKDKLVNKEENSTKSKAELRAERRAIQEAQRAAKGLLKKEDKNASQLTKATPTTKTVKFAPDVKFGDSPDNKSGRPGSVLKQVKLVSHLPQNKPDISVIKAVGKGVHPSVIKLGLQYAAGTICGSNARCVNFIHTLVQVIRDFKIPDNKDFNVAVYSMCIEPTIQFLEKCRPISVGMKNVCKMLREEISNIPKDLSENEIKLRLEESLNIFLENHIFKAHDSIINLAKDKITSEDVIVTYGCSYIVKKVLKRAHETCKFRVIVVDGRPKLEGRNMLRYLVKNGIDCTYVLINSLAHVMSEATKVFIGAHALLANGYVMSRVGSSQVALVAKAFNKPVLVCCETYKFCDMVQTDSFVINELGTPEELIEINHRYHPLSQWRNINTLNILNLCYDVTPPDLVTVLINEGYVLPCTSVPVVLRVKPKKNNTVALASN